MNLSEQETSTKCLIGVIHYSPQTRYLFFETITWVRGNSKRDYFQSFELPKCTLCSQLQIVSVQENVSWLPASSCLFFILDI